jgi:hypothetical protein
MGPLTSDPKMVRFQSHQVGLRLTYQFAFLTGWLRGLRAVAMDANLDRGWTTSSFDNYWVGSIGGRVAF